MFATVIEFNRRKANFVRMEGGEGIGETGWALGHRMKVREALDLVTFLTGLLNSSLRVITMETPNDTINW